MEVLKKGISPKTWRLEKTCQYCTARLSISYKDITLTTTRTFFTNEHVLHYHTYCPECGHKVPLNKESIPSIIQKAIYNNMSLEELLLNFYFS